MNAYFIITDEIELVDDIVEACGAPCRITSRGRLSDLVFAETRGKARALFCKHHPYPDSVGFTDPMSVRLVAKAVDRPAGIADYLDPLWSNVCEDYFYDGGES